jgi:FkbM family methyltransferase
LSSIPNSSIVFDIGANVGNWSKFAINIAPNIQLHCFEPVSSTYKELSRHKWPENVHLNNTGMGDQEGVMEINIACVSSTLNSLYRRSGVEASEITSKEKIIINTVDRYCFHKKIKEIHFLKVDVEGHELAVLKGMRRMLTEGRVGMIQFEYGGCNLDARVYLGDIWEFLQQFNFSIYKIFPTEIRRIPKYTQLLETFKYSNWLAQKDDKQ